MQKITIVVIALALLIGTTSSVLASRYILNIDTVEFTVEKGWNLVSYLVLDELQMSYSESHGIYAYLLNPSSKKYLGGTLREFEQQIANNTDTNDQYTQYINGFWIYNRGEPFTVVFDPTMAKDEYASILLNLSKQPHLKSGWNLFSINSLTYNKTPLQIKGGCNIYSIYRYNASSKKWVGGLYEYEKNNLFGTEILGGAVAIKVVNDCSLDFSIIDETPKAPSLPNQ